MNKERFFEDYPVRHPDSNKSDNGRILFVSGSHGMAGAAILNICGGEAVGASYIHALLPESIYPIVAANKITTVYHPDPLDDPQFLLRQNVFSRIDALAIGSGLDNHPYKKDYLRAALTDFKGPIVVDACGLRILAEDEKLFSLHDSLILTPHLGEFSALCALSIDEILADRENIAVNYAVKNKVDLVLKGPRTIHVTKDGAVYINDSGNDILARAGSGDVLTGMICGLCALYDDYHLAVRDAVWLHGHLADRALSRHSKEAFDLTVYPLLADEFFFER